MNSKADHFYLFIYSFLSVQQSTGFCLPGWNHPSELFSDVKRDHLRESQQERKEAEVSRGRKKKRPEKTEGNFGWDVDVEPSTQRDRLTVINGISDGEICFWKKGGGSGSFQRRVLQQKFVGGEGQEMSFSFFL